MRRVYSGKTKALPIPMPPDAEVPKNTLISFILLLKGRYCQMHSFLCFAQFFVFLGVSLRFAFASLRVGCSALRYPLIGAKKHSSFAPTLGLHSLTQRIFL